MSNRAGQIILSLLLIGSRARAEPMGSPLPADVTMNKVAGKGGLLTVKVRLESGEEWPFVVDTGSPDTVLDKSFQPKLGKCLSLGTLSLWGFSEQRSGLYAAPKLYLGNVPLRTGGLAALYDFKKASSFFSHGGIRGILGMDCLSNYCLQLDFEAGKMRFLDSHNLNATGLGKPYPLKFSTNDWISGIPMIQKVGLLGGAATNTEIDTGENLDGSAEGKAIRQHAAGSYSGGLIKRFKHFLAVKGIANRAVVLQGCVWEGNTYTNIGIDRRWHDLPNEFGNSIGLSFLARHLVTLDFPNQVMYLRKTRVGPLPE